MLLDLRRVSIVLLWNFSYGEYPFQALTSNNVSARPESVSHSRERMKIDDWQSNTRCDTADIMILPDWRFTSAKQYCAFTNLMCWFESEMFEQCRMLSFVHPAVSTHMVCYTCRLGLKCSCREPCVCPSLL